MAVYTLNDGEECKDNEPKKMEERRNSSFISMNKLMNYCYEVFVFTMRLFPHIAPQLALELFKKIH